MGQFLGITVDHIMFQAGNMSALAKKHIDDTEKAMGYLSRIESSSKQLLMLINAVLELSRMESHCPYLQYEDPNIRCRCHG